MEQGMTRWCEHCDAEPRAYRNGLGRACEAYRRKYHRRPPTDVLRARIVRQVEADLERRAWGAA